MKEVVRVRMLPSPLDLPDDEVDGRRAHRIAGDDERAAGSIERQVVDGQRLAVGGGRISDGVAGVDVALRA